MIVILVVVVVVHFASKETLSAGLGICQGLART